MILDENKKAKIFYSRDDIYKYDREELIELGSGEYLLNDKIVYEQLSFKDYLYISTKK